MTRSWTTEYRENNTLIYHKISDRMEVYTDCRKSIATVLLDGKVILKQKIEGAADYLNFLLNKEADAKKLEAFKCLDYQY